MRVQIESQEWVLPHNLKMRPLFWCLNIKGPEGEFWRYVPFTVTGSVGTVEGNLFNVFTRIGLAGNIVTDLYLPRVARNTLPLKRSEGIANWYYLWGARVQFNRSPSKIVTFRGSDGSKVEVPWE